MEDTLLELLEVCQQKEFYCMHNNVDDLIESALNAKLLSINLKSQRLDKKKHNIVEQPIKRGTRYEHLSTIPETEFDEVIKSSIRNLLPILSEYEVTSDDESECDVPVKDESSSVFITFSNPVFDDNDDFTSSDDESISSDEDVPMEDFKVYSNPLFDDDEIKSDKLDPYYFNTESDFIESLSNQDSLFESSSKFDYLEEIIETLPTSPILTKDSDSQREEIDIFTSMDDLMPPGIESDNYDSEGDIHFLEELLVNDSIVFPKREVISAVMKTINELNEDECFDSEGEIMFLKMLKMTITFPSYLSFEIFYRISLTMRFLLYFSPLGVKTPFLTLASPLRAGGISSGWNFHVL
uniref:Reverse transcriptase domain-containing protein n=1 Tax=Tanacetum cinerariifolium TaxID=118510 RepID=A0A6L2LBC1_TANCI|nr:hypothetical protein [Tanacetum cinerariifolium]